MYLPLLCLVLYSSCRYYLGEFLLPALTALALILNGGHLGQAEGDGGQQGIGQCL